MIIELNHSSECVANQIYSVFQKSYTVEARLIGVLDFPPLLRSVVDIKDSKTKFFGFSDNEALAAVIELEIEDGLLDIHSLTVEPSFFRKGIAGKLIGFALQQLDYSTAIVETAVANSPAINLYKKHGIEKLAMSVEHTA